MNIKIKKQLLPLLPLILLVLTVSSANLITAGDFSDDRYFDSVVTDNSDRTLSQQIQAAIDSANSFEVDLLAILNAVDVLGDYSFSAPIQDILSSVRDDENGNLAAIQAAKGNLKARLADIKALSVN